MVASIRDFPIHFNDLSRSIYRFNALNQSLLLVAMFCYCQSNSVAAEGKRNGPTVDSGRIYSNKSYIQEFREVRDLWSSEIANSEQIQTLIKQEYPILSASDEDKILDLVDEILIVRHDGVGSALALTNPNLEPTYPLPGKIQKSYQLPAIASGRPFGYSPVPSETTALFEYRIAVQNDLKSKLLAKITELYQAYEKYCQSLERSEQETKELSESASRRHEDRAALVKLVGLNAVQKLDVVLEVDNVK